MVTDKLIRKLSKKKLNLHFIQNKSLLDIPKRKKGRDLFDLAISIKELKPDEKKIIKCFMHYMNEMGLTVSRAEFEENLEYKGNDPAFVGDILPLLSEPRNSEAEFYNDLNSVKEKLISLLPGEPWKGAKLLPLEAETAD